MSRTLIEYVVQAALGAGVLFLGAIVSQGPWLMFAALGALAVACGLWETRRRTGPRRWFAPWLPAIIGMVVLTVVTIATGPQGPDSGLATSMVVAVALVLIPVFAAVTLLTVSVAGRMMGERAA